MIRTWVSAILRQYKCSFCQTLTSALKLLFKQTLFGASNKVLNWFDMFWKKKRQLPPPNTAAYLGVYQFLSERFYFLFDSFSILSWVIHRVKTIFYTNNFNSTSNSFRYHQKSFSCNFITSSEGYFDEACRKYCAREIW